jgi:hydroxypyruvate isomerase
VPYDVLLESTDPAVVEFELDLYWITDGGSDPLAYFARWPGRFPLVHVKDKAADGKMVDVGAGRIDWKAILHQRKEAGIALSSTMTPGSVRLGRELCLPELPRRLTMNRRELLAASAGALLLRTTGGRSDGRTVGQTSVLGAQSSALNPHLKQSVSYWPFERMPLAEFARAARNIGLVAIDLLQPEQWPVVADAGLACSMGYPTARRDFIATGFNDSTNHAMLLRELEAAIPLAASSGVPNVIAMFGNRRGRSDEAGAAACIEGLSRIKALAEQERVTVCVELLNSRVDHADYMGDHTAFGARVIRAVDSPRVKLLYDIYHMQIMEGDVIRTIRD